ncbi:lysosome-associated membrane glycoprotein 2-like [Sinocyclocheilus grahami]|uniref:Lysosome-associated membrane glycoprotein 2-like n=1 Tax=Sinocyclocheilus grahami TaxID=75366 RepID=A0A672NUR1_SINGR|nr:PREDICTED: lysosome-associated membrane glycoprotein 2-like [Sinocyclocheilus grahami]
MAVRGCVTLLFILLCGIVHADDLVTSPLPAIQKLSTNQIISSTSSPTTNKPSSAATSAAVTTEFPTTHHNTTNSTTEPPTTPHHNTTNSTTEPPTTPHHNTTNSTTEAPTTAHSNATTAPTPPPTSPPVPNPTVGNYSVKSDNVTVCLLAKMGLQFSFKMSENASFQTLNLDPSPNVTEVSGACGSGGNDSSLVLKSEEITVHFIFTNVSQKFRLHALMLSVNLANGNVFNASNNNLSLWEASVGSSYMCKKEQSYNITDKLTINTFELQVQPFAVQNNKFNTGMYLFVMLKNKAEIIISSEVIIQRMYNS